VPVKYLCMCRVFTLKFSLIIVNNCTVAANAAPQRETCEALKCVLTFVTNELSACWLGANDCRSAVVVYPIHTRYSHSSIGCTEISPKYESLDTWCSEESAKWSASQNYKASAVIQWRRLLSESVICHACPMILLFLLEADIMSCQCGPKMAYFFICSCQSLNAQTLLTKQMIQTVCHIILTSHISHLSGYILVGNIILDIVDWIGYRVKCGLWEQTAEAMRAKSELEVSSASLWLPLGSHRAPSGGKPATLAYQLLELYCSLQTKPSLQHRKTQTFLNGCF